MIGAGFSGLSAAVRLAAAGKSVIVVEQAPRLGGRATSFVDRESGERVDNGQHALFGCYRETYAFLKEIGADGQAPLQKQLSLVMADDRSTSLTAGRSTALTARPVALTAASLPAPWHLLAGLMRWPAISWRDRASALRLARVLLQIRSRGPKAVADTVPPNLTVADWLRQNGQSPVLCDWLWHPLSIAALNQLPMVAAAAPFVRVLGELFAPDPAASTIGLPSVPLEDLYGPPAQAFLAARRGEIRLRTPAAVCLDDAGTVLGVRAGDDDIETPIVISSVPWHSFDRIWPDNAPPAAIAGIARNASSLGSSPIVTVNLWFDRSAADAIGAPFVGLVGGPMHWIFNRSAIVKENAEHISVVASGADDLLRLENAQLTELAVAQLNRALPGLRALTLKRSVVVREPRATFSLAPGGAPRPGAVTPIPGFFLAGDWTDTGLPGTIEGAVQSGHTAAAAVLSQS